MNKKWIAVNLLLLMIAALAGWQLRRTVLRFDSENDLAKIQPAQSIKSQLAQEKVVPRVIAAHSYNPAEFTIIPEKNVFTESRSREDKVVEEAPPEPPPLTQKPILVGVTLIDSQYRASIIEPSAPQERGAAQNRRAQIKKVGDVYRGYTITTISADGITLESGTRKEIIPLHEGSKKGMAGKTAILSTRIVPIGGGGTTGGTPVSTAGGTPPRTAASPSVGRPNAPAAEPVSAAASPGLVPVTVPAAGASGAAAAPAVRGTAAPARGATDAQGQRIIRTPFGDIVRPNR